MKIRKGLRRLLGMAFIGTLVVSACIGGIGASRSGKSGGGAQDAKRPDGPRPNIVLVLADDLSQDLIQYMPNVQAMQRRGVTFTQHIVADSLCCPSRATIFTGRYPHNTGVRVNDPPSGGWQVFNQRGGERESFGVTLQSRGYRTAMMGKYMNGYHPDRVQAGRMGYVPPGWTEWYGTGQGYRNYEYLLSENGSLVSYGSEPQDYLTDVIADKGKFFVQRAALARQPFLLELSTFAPHSPYTPAKRHEKLYPGLRAPRGPAFNEGDLSDKPRWLRGHRKLSAADIKSLDSAHRKRVRSVKSVDEMIGALQRTLAWTGQDRNTYVVFTSDNGFHLGQHRMTEGKMTPYDHDVRVPLIVTGPGVPAGAKVHRLTQNTDFAPTFAELAGARIPPRTDGRSLVPFLRGAPVAQWRTAALIEHAGPNFQPDDPDLPISRGGNPPTYNAVRTANELYVEYGNGDREYYDLVRDPHQLANAIGRVAPARRAELQSMLAGLIRCAGTTCKRY
jgi:arylsulfatase A-like enzyme